MTTRLVPIKNSVLCRKVEGGKSLRENGGILSKEDSVDVYEILEYAKDSDVAFNFSLGDSVISNSTGDEIEINPGEVVYLFKIENIMCRVVD